MAWQNPPDSVLRNILHDSHTIAVVGCSPEPDRTSHQIARSMQARGYLIIPVHPSGGEILGETTYADLEQIPADIAIDIVNVFLRSERTLPVAEAAVRRGAKALWLQQGVVNEDAYRVGRAGGLEVVMDACIATYHRMLCH